MKKKVKAMIIESVKIKVIKFYNKKQQIFNNLYKD